jgi:hypothetical protein
VVRDVREKGMNISWGGNLQIGYFVCGERNAEGKMLQKNEYYVLTNYQDWFRTSELPFLDASSSPPLAVSAAFMNNKFKHLSLNFNTQLGGYRQEKFSCRTVLNVCGKLNYTSIAMYFI